MGSARSRAGHSPGLDLTARDGRNDAIHREAMFLPRSSKPSIKLFLAAESGATAIEYALIAAGSPVFIKFPLISPSLR